MNAQIRDSMLIVCLSIAALTLPLSAIQIMGNDEIYTFEVARQPGFGAIWSALANGADNHPPLNYWVRHLVMRVFGSSPFVFRLPGVVSICVAGMALFRLVARRLERVHAAAAVIFMMLICGLPTALAGRSYALLVCMFAIAINAWDNLSDDPASTLQQFVLLLALVAAVYTHYYGVLYLAAFGIAALVQGLFEHRFPAAKMVILAMAAIACLPLYPLLKAAGQYKGIYWASSTLSDLLSFYSDLLGMAVPAFALMAILLFLTERPGGTEMAFPLPTALALAAFALLPIALFAMAKLYTGAFLPRFVPASGVAVCIMALALSAKVGLERRVRIAALILIPALFLGVAWIRQARAHRLFSGLRQQFVEKLKNLERSAGVPVVLGDDGLFVELSYSHPQDLGNCFFLYNPLPDHITSVDRSVQGLQQIMPLHAEMYDRMIAAHRSLLFVGKWGDPLLRRAYRDHAIVEYHSGNASELEYWKITATLSESDP